MKVLFLAPVLALCSGCAAIPPSMLLSGAMGLIDMNQKKIMAEKLDRIETALNTHPQRAAASNFDYSLFQSSRGGLRVSVVTQ